MLEVRGLTSGYEGIQILNGLSFTMNDAEFLGILGHNGMGKSTLLKTLVGLLPTQSGTIAFQGKRIERTKPHQRSRYGIGYVPQGRGIFPSLTVLENCQFAAAAHARDLSTVEKVLNYFPRLERLLGRQGGTLSGGEQQLLALARVLVQGPKLILLDEPTEGIQPSIIDEIVETLLTVRQERGLSILLVEQNIDFIRALTDRVLLLQKGVIIAERDPRQFSDDEAMGSFTVL